MLVVVAAAEVVAAALTAPQFNITAVDVYGVQATPREQVDSVTQSIVGQNFLRVPLQTTLAAVEAIPTVREAHAERLLSWPPRIALNIQERQPFAAVGWDRQWWVVDDEGVPFREMLLADSHLYRITLAGHNLADRLPLSEGEEGESLQTTADEPMPVIEKVLWADLSRLVTWLHGSPGDEWSLRRIYVDKNGFVSLRVTGGSQDELLVRLGPAPWAGKLTRAKQALAYFDRTGKQAMELNLISFERPTWRPRPEPQEKKNRREADSSCSEEPASMGT